MQPKQHLLANILNAGLNDQNPTIFNGRLRVQNAFALISLVFAFPFIGSIIYIGHFEAASIFFLLQVGLAISLRLNHARLYRVSKLLMLVLVSSSLPLLSYTLGYDAGFYLYFFLTPLLSLSLYEFSDIRNVTLTASILFISFLLTECLHFFDVPPIVLLEPKTLDLLFQFNLLVGLVILSVITYNVVKYHHKLSQEVLDMNRGLKANKKEQEKIIDQKNILLAEVHHRVKNNLAVISSLFNLQLNQIENPEAREILRSNSNRINSMSLVHNSLYQFGDVSKIEMGNYIKNLSTELANSYKRKDTQIVLSYSLDELHLELERAIPCGMLVNEVLVNAFKHAFSDNGGVINIGLSKKDDMVVLIISDNGKGFDQEQDLKQESLGLFLIDSLIAQLDGTVEMNLSEGASYTFIFPI